MKSNDIQKTINEITANAREASLAIQDFKKFSLSAVDKALLKMAELLASEKKMLQKENAKDVAAAKKKKLHPAMIDRLTLSNKTITSMIKGLKEVAALESPVNMIYEERERPNGLVIAKIKVPIGVIGIIYESRPNVTVDAAAICLKSRNAVILRGGSEAFHSNTALCALFIKAIEHAGLPKNILQFIPTTERAAVEMLLQKDEHVDLIIPRGGESLIRMVVEKSRIPVIKHYKGVCHIFVSRNANIDKAIPVVVNAKVQRPGVCNAMETLLLDSKLSLQNRKKIINALLENGVTIYGDKKTCKLSEEIEPVDEKNFYDEYLDLRLSVATVDGIDAAIAHINKYGSRHTDAIVSESREEATAFISRVDTASVMINASTRFADGGEYGMGCEIGISTDKLHSRGPMGIDELTTYKWIVIGFGQIRE